MPKYLFPPEIIPSVHFTRAEGQFPSAEAAFHHWMSDCLALPDPIERGEDRAEVAFLDSTRGVPDGKWRCPRCEEIRDLEDSYPISADPYSSTACHVCIEEMFPDAFKVKS